MPSNPRGRRCEASPWPPAALLLPAQIENRHPDIALPERRLAVAVLAQAIHSFLRYALTATTRERRLYREAEEWIFAAPDDWPFSFANLCRALALDPSYLRSRLRQWRERSGAAAGRTGRRDRKRLRGGARGGDRAP